MGGIHYRIKANSLTDRTLGHGHVRLPDGELMLVPTFRPALSHGHVRLQFGRPMAMDAFRPALSHGHVRLVV